MAANLNVKVNGAYLSDPRFKPFIDSNGVFNWNGVIIKPSGSVRIGETKIHPSGLIQANDEVHVEGVVAPKQPHISKPAGASHAAIKSTQSASRSILSENSSKANVKRKDATIARANAGDNDAQLAGSKRKSVDAAPESAKKQKTTAAQNASNNTERQNAAQSASGAPPDIDDIELPGQMSDNVAVYESCDQVRRRIEAHLLQKGVTKAQFCRDLTDQLFSPGGPAKIQSSMVDAFRKKRGPTSGCTSSVYYTAYVFFEKWRIVQNEAKCKHRIEMEKIWPGGAERDRDDAHRGIWCAPGERPRQDAYGRWQFH